MLRDCAFITVQNSINYNYLSVTCFLPKKYQKYLAFLSSKLTVKGFMELVRTCIFRETDLGTIKKKSV